MALDLGDLNEYFDASMTVTIDGKRYTIPALSAKLGLWGRKVAVMRADVPENATAEEIETAWTKVRAEIGPMPKEPGQSDAEALLSPATVAEMVADGVSDQAIEHLSGTVYARIVLGDEGALAYFRRDDPKASPANRQERRAAKKAAPRKASSSKTTNTAAVPTPRKAASGSTTKSPPAKGAKAAPASPGRKSSSAGR